MRVHRSTPIPSVKSTRPASVKFRQIAGVPYPRTHDESAYEISGATPWARKHGRGQSRPVVRTNSGRLAHLSLRYCSTFSAKSRQPEPRRRVLGPDDEFLLPIFSLVFFFFLQANPAGIGRTTFRLFFWHTVGNMSS